MIAFLMMFTVSLLALAAGLIIGYDWGKNDTRI